MQWPWSKTQGQGVNWEEMIVKTSNNVTKYGDQISRLETAQKEHVEKQDKDFEGLKTQICQKIGDIKCPRNGEIDAIVGGQEKGKERYGELKKSVDDFVTEIKDEKAQKAGEKKAFKKIMIRTGYILGAVSSITGIVTKIIGVW